MAVALETQWARTRAGGVPLKVRGAESLTSLTKSWGVLKHVSSQSKSVINAD